MLMAFMDRIASGQDLVNERSIGADFQRRDDTTGKSKNEYLMCE